MQKLFEEGRTLAHRGRSADKLNRGVLSESRAGGLSPFSKRSTPTIGRLIGSEQLQGFLTMKGALEPTANFLVAQVVNGHRCFHGQRL